MILRRLLPLLRKRLSEFPAVALLGPRQVGKTTLALALHDDSAATPNPDYLDLENPVDLAKLEDAAGYLRLQSDRLVIIDEVHRVPGLFGVLRGIIDERIRAGQQAGQFLLLGSASIDLLKQSSESLAGRITYLELGPFDIRETEPDAETNLWVRGGFPRSLLATTDDASAAWRDSFVATYLEATSRIWAHTFRPQHCAGSGPCSRTGRGRHSTRQSSREVSP